MNTWVGLLRCLGDPTEPGAVYSLFVRDSGLFSLVLTDEDSKKAAPLVNAPKAYITVEGVEQDGWINVAKLEFNYMAVMLPLVRDEQFRQKILAGQDQLINSRLWRFMSQDQQRMTLAARATFSANNPVTNSFIDQYEANYNQQQGDRHETQIGLSMEELHDLGVNASIYRRVAEHLLGAVPG